MKSRYLNVGDKVKILRIDIKDKPSDYGFIESIDGSYLMVRFFRSKRVVELYPNEVEKISTAAKSALSQRPSAGKKGPEIIKSRRFKTKQQSPKNP